MQLRYICNIHYKVPVVNGEIERMPVMSETFYRRVKHGKSVRYEPASEYETWDAYPEGHWLVTIRPGNKSIRRVAKPDYPGLQAAMEKTRNAMEEAMRKGYELQYRPIGNIGVKQGKDRISVAARKALDDAKDAMNGQDAEWIRPCVADAVDAGFMAIMKELTSATSHKKSK